MIAISKNSVIRKQYKNGKSINQIALLTKAVKASRKEILDAEKNQLNFGFGSDGKKIEPKYKSDDYAFDKNQQNQLAGYGTPDLYLSGDMYRNMDLSLTGGKYFFVSNVSYFNDLTDKYQTAFALSAKSLKLVKDETITPKYNKLYHEALNK